jgi:hypothetical protein
MEYTDTNGKKWVKIRNFKALSSAMKYEYGSTWKYKVRYIYGDEELGL